MAEFLVLHGPNLNLLGTREPNVYGSTTLEEINQTLVKQARNAGHKLACFQSNSESDLIDRIHQAGRDKVDMIIINPAALTHTSIAIRDALLGVAIPFIEVHLSNVFSREAFRQHSFLSDQAIGVISGLGSRGYSFALEAAIQQIQHQP